MIIRKCSLSETPDGRPLTTELSFIEACQKKFFEEYMYIIDL